LILYSLPHSLYFKMIPNKLVYFSLGSSFRTALGNDNIDPSSIVFVGDEKFIYAQGNYYYGSSGDITSVAINSLEDIL